MPKDETNGIELAGVVLPANVMLPNGSSTLTLGNSMSFAEGEKPEHTIIRGTVKRILFFEQTAAVRVDIVDSEGGVNSGQAYICSSGMVCYVRASKKEEAKKP